jgi:hypothetical protein
VKQVTGSRCSGRSSGPPTRLGQRPLLVLEPHEWSLRSSPRGASTSE